MSSSPESQAALAISLARGPLIGTFIGLFLYGVTCLQTFFYFQTYVHDRVALKITVAVLLVFETVHAALSIWVMDDYLVKQYGNQVALEVPTWSSTATYIIGFLIDYLVYLYFTWRIWIFTENIWICIFMMLIVTGRTALSLIACIFRYHEKIYRFAPSLTSASYSMMGPTWSAYLQRSSAIILSANVLFIVGDTFSASVMTYHLNKRRSGMYRTDLLINRLLIFAVATGALTSLVDVIALIFSMTQPRSLAFMGPILVQTRLYANSLLTSLNIRNANARAFNDLTSLHGQGIDPPAVSLRFTRPVDLSTMSEENERRAENRAEKSTVDSWHTAHGSGMSSSRVSV
ncbi:hypothetical protein BS17DRAFT_805759 [Gyrodon lividus]|nr:hypothetical protein BS17DRAFT_805759 [Gyrodon lividus]